MDRSRLALMTEWNFSQGKLKSYDDLIKWSIYLAHILQAPHSKKSIHVLAIHKSIQRGAAEILKDLHPVWKKLSYGGRTAKDLSPERVKYLEEKVQAMAA
jgi:hypothetical protein